MKSLSLLAVLSIVALPPLASAEQALSMDEMDGISAGGASFTNPALEALRTLGKVQGTTVEGSWSAGGPVDIGGQYVTGCNQAAALYSPSCGGGDPTGTGGAGGAGGAALPTPPAEVSPSVGAISQPGWLKSQVSSPGNPEVFAIDFVHQRINNSR